MSAYSPRKSIPSMRLLWMSLVIGGLLIPVMAHALEFEPVAANLPVNINPGSISKSQITVSGIASSILNIQCQVYIQYPNPGYLVLLLTAPNGATICLADSDGTINNSNENTTTTTTGDNGGVVTGGGGIGLAGVGSSSGGFGSGQNDAPGGMVEFSNLNTVIPSIDQYQNSNATIIPSGVYTPTEPPSTLFQLYVEPILALTPPYFVASGYPLATPGYNLNQFRGFADLSLNGVWTLQVWNFDPNNNTGAIQWWALEINQVGTHVWTGAGLDNRFSDQNNWAQPTGAPQSWEQKAVVTFPASAGQFTANNDVAGLTIGNLTFDGNYAITGDAVTLTGNAIVSNEGGTSNWAPDMGLTYQAPKLKAPNSSVQATGPTFYVNGGQLVLSGVLGGNGQPGYPDMLNAVPAFANINIAGVGTLTMAGVNQYLGETFVNSGVLQITNGSCLSGSDTEVSPGGMLVLGGTNIPATPLTVAPSSPTPWPYPAGSGAVSQSLVLNGFGNASSLGALENIVPGSNINMTGPIDLAAVDVGLGAAPTAALTFAVPGQLTGGNLDFIGQQPAPGGGILNLQTQPNSGLSVNGGTANINIPAPGVSQVTTLALGSAGAVVIQGASLAVVASITSYPLGLTASPNTITGNLNFIAGGLPITVNPGPDVTPDLILAGGSLTSSAGFTKLGSGRLVDNLTAVAPLPQARVANGTFGGTGQVGVMSINGGAVLEPGFNATGTLSATNVTMAPASLYTADLGGGATLAVSGSLTLGTASGTNGPLLRPVGGGAGTYTIITYPAATLTTAFYLRPFPTSPGIDYAVGGTAVQLTLDGSSVALQSSTYSFSKGAGNVPIPVTWITGSAPPASSILVGQSITAVQGQDYNQPTPVPLTQTIGSSYTLPIVQNYISEGNTTFKILLVPLGYTTAAPNASEAVVTIIDNQNDDYNPKHCGFGSGLTVFFLGSLVLFVRLRQRRR